MHRALTELVIEGVETSRDFHLRVMEDDDFRRGAIEIQWLERRLPSLLEAKPPEALRQIAAIAGALLADRERSAPRAASATAPGTPPPAASGWKRAARIEGLR